MLTLPLGLLTLLQSKSLPQWQGIDYAKCPQALKMHLISCQSGSHYTGFYQNESILTRQNSLPYTFRKLRIHRNLTKAALAKKFYVTEDYVSKIESGDLPPSLKYCLQCGEEFGFNPYWIKTKWSNEIIERFSNRLKRRLGLEN